MRIYDRLSFLFLIFKPYIYTPYIFVSTLKIYIAHCIVCVTCGRMELVILIHCDNARLLFLCAASDVLCFFYLNILKNIKFYIIQNSKNTS